ncbi:MAG: MFS transporter [Trueperaceae bacterium]|nr:MAG: MFS transporter [Trueperaceae bacterium]
MKAFTERDATDTQIRTFWLLALTNVFVGGMVGLERTVVPLLGRDVFGLTLGVAVGAFIVSFSVSKAVVNLFAGVAADRFGRKRVLVAGWLVGLPVPVLLISAPSWEWVLVANILLGVNQALTWSMTVNMMVDLMPAHRRGFAAGINEFAGYLGVSLLAFLTGLVASSFSLRPEPFYLGIAAVVLGLTLSLFASETAPAGTPPPFGWVIGVGVPSVLGCATNFKDGLVWLSLPILLSGRGLTLVEIGTVAGLYPLVWALGQPFFGPLSDRIGRKPLVTSGMGLQGLGLVVLALSGTFALTILAALMLGLGTGMVYPTLIASVADRVSEERRATALGIYRFFRDGGYAVGAVIAGLGLAALGPTLLVAGIGILVVTVLAMGQL